MKSYACLLLLLSSVACAWQVDPQENLAKSLCPLWSENLYVRSLSACLDASAATRRSGTNLIVLQNSVLGDLEPVQILPSKIGAVNIEYLSTPAIKKRYETLGKPLHVMEIKPLTNSKDELIVDCTVYSVGLRRWKLLLGVSGGYLVHWHFDCAAREFVQGKVEDWKFRVD